MVLLQNLKPLSISPYHVPEQNRNSVKGLTKQFSIPSSQTFALLNDINRPRSRISGPSGLLLKFGIISYTISSTSRKGDETIRMSLQRRVQKSIRVKNFRIRKMFLVRMNQVSDIENFRGFKWPSQIKSSDWLKTHD